MVSQFEHKHVTSTKVGSYFEIRKIVFGFSRKDAFGTDEVYPVVLTRRE